MKIRRRRLVPAAVAAACVLSLACLAGVALARKPTIHVRPARVLAGARVRVFGNADGCPRGDRVTLISSAFSHRHDFAGRPAVLARVGRRGRYGVRVRIPRRRHAGRYLITGRCGGGSFPTSAHLRVLRP